MAQEPPYHRQYVYGPLAPATFPGVGTQLEVEFDGLAANLNGTSRNLAKLQRDDGALGNSTVHPEALDRLTLQLIAGGWTLRGTWATATAYSRSDVVAQSGSLYLCLTSHTAGTFATDLAAGKWLFWASQSSIPGAGVIEPYMLASDFILPLAMLQNWTPPGSGAVARSVGDRLAEWVFITDYGADRTGTAGCSSAFTSAIARAEATGAMIVIPHGTFNLDAPITFPAQNSAGILQFGRVNYSGSAGTTAITIGTDTSTGKAYNWSRSYTGLRLFRATQADWTNEADTGIKFINPDDCDIDIRNVENFTIGVQLLGQSRGVQYNRLRLGRLVNNKVGLDLATGSASGWCNDNSFWGGIFACDSSVNTTLDRWGVRLNAASGAYVLHNANRFHDPSFSLQWQGVGGPDAIPFQVNVSGLGLHVSGIRMEACSPYVAQHSAGHKDTVYEISYGGGWGYNVDVRYTSSATRAGASVIQNHQAGPNVQCTRLLAAVENLRVAAFTQTAQSSGGIGFDTLAVLSGNPSGGPTTLNTIAFAGLGTITLNSESVGLTTSRALGFIVDCSVVKDFAIQAEGLAITPCVVCFDGSENVLGQAYKVLASGETMNWRDDPSDGPSYWWSGNANFDNLSTTSSGSNIKLYEHQRVTLPAAAQKAFIGISGGYDASNPNPTCTALRVFVPPLHVPQIFYGGPRLWGTREFTFSASITPGAITAGGRANFTVSTPYVQAGDTIAVGYSNIGAYYRWTGNVTTTGASGTTTVWCENLHPSSTLTPAAGTVTVRVRKAQA